jgi:hypothetical protein
MTRAAGKRLLSFIGVLTDFLFSLKGSGKGMTLEIKRTLETATLFRSLLRLYILDGRTSDHKPL